MRTPAILIVVALTAALLPFQNCAGPGVSEAPGSVSVAQKEMAAILADEVEQECEYLAVETAAGRVRQAPKKLTGRADGAYRVSGSIRIENAEGNVYFQGPARVESVSGFRGNLVLCSVGVGAVRDVDGNVLVFNADVDSIQDLRGNLVVNNGYVKGEIQAPHGLVAEKSDLQTLRVR